MNESKCKVSTIGIILLIIGCCFIVPGCYLSWQTQDGFQYIVPAEDLETTTKGASAAIGSLGEVAVSTTIAARKQGSTLNGVRQDMGITLYAANDDYPALCHETLKAGRLISPGDVQEKRQVIVVDENTAYALFSGGDAIGKSITIDQADWTIVGVVSRKARYGESAEGVAFIPLSTAAEKHLKMDTLEIRVIGGSGNGSEALLQTTLTQWRSDGTFLSLEREKYAATMPLHWAVVIAGLLLSVRMIKYVIEYAAKQLGHYRQRLQSNYALELFWWIAGRILLLLLLATIAAAITIITLKLLTAPALVFTDWIPEKPVSISSYASRFWAIHRESAKAIQYTSREMSTIMLAAWLIRWGGIAALGGCFITTKKWRNTK